MSGYWERIAKVAADDKWFDVHPTSSTTWYAKFNDLVGGWIVTTLNQPLSEHDNRRQVDIDRPGSPPAGPRGYVIAECMAHTDAELIAYLLNTHGVERVSSP